jgi:hypothetical protein
MFKDKLVKILNGNIKRNEYKREGVVVVVGVVVVSERSPKEVFLIRSLISPTVFFRKSSFKFISYMYM